MIAASDVGTVAPRGLGGKTMGQQDMPQSNYSHAIDKISAGFVAEFAPQLLLLVETAPNTRGLTEMVERAICGLRYAAQERYAELRNTGD